MQNKSRLKIWVCEFVSAGGLASEPLPASLLQEGLLMRDALLADLFSLGIDCITSHDARVQPAMQARSMPVSAADDAFAIWQQQLATGDVDACWVVAPETGGVLHRMQQLVAEAGKYWIGCAGDAIRLASSKSQMADICYQAGIPVLPHIYLQQFLPGSPLPWQTSTAAGFVVKPDDGAGCEFTFYFKNKSELFEFKHKIQSSNNSVYHKLLLQPYITGEALSMSVVSTDDQVKVIAAHRQWIVIEEGAFQFRGAGVNQASRYLPLMQNMAENIHRAMPGLVGYWGADLILAEDQQLVLVEINPRLTTPYTELSKLLAENPARMILDAVLDNRLTGLTAQSSLALDLVELSEKQAI
ncbi:Predicted ATP-dependent carboligase, ATP-grasp superfamily [Methylophilus rhizosphaerae]|uniref:Predicted ATP-dependent carboligase, ATP-grasp superfamily n=1 Tax=Methylophilus rhizosphaerae TaxID=492660 RepID=A0A1G9AV90_9PROT|nr:ATP-grasp domain-containing protein [Methylophilus rhizosphaerae]SDK31226.1 Predicted ATP-dependent carboligase, ATP-grasp superfamily [Methylophilus rhizosphaerae]